MSWWTALVHSVVFSFGSRIEKYEIRYAPLALRTDDVRFLDDVRYFQSRGIDNFD